MAEDDRKGSSEWRDFFWNPRTHELLGRTAASWGQYHGIRARLRESVWLGIITDFYNPFDSSSQRMMIRPKGNQLEITFSTSDTESWDGFIHNLNSFLSPYNDSYQVQTNDECTPDEYFIQEDSGEVRNNPKRSCQFNRTMLEECSGVLDRFYGYDKGQPCILIKLNRVIGMLPGKDRQSPYVTCAAKVCKPVCLEDSDKIGPLAYYPPNGTFNLMYYPYYGKKAQVNYTQPLVAVKFLNASLNTDINVECKFNFTNPIILTAFFSVRISKTTRTICLALQ
uniref:Sodium/potassium-transporting ATPase subunit beta n=1 Tax=Pundamilia nyererei TaxID=303518 RepID=A0A3B4FC31_9CICH